MLKIIKNPDEKTFKEVLNKVKNNDGFCPCKIEHTPDTKCMCKEFREQNDEGLCHCGLYKKVNKE